MQHQADLGKPGPGPGDQFIYAGDVFDRPGGVFLGTTGGSCTTLTGNDTSGQETCNATFNLAGGQIVVQGVVDTAAVFAPATRRCRCRSSEAPGCTGTLAATALSSWSRVSRT